MNAIIMAAGTSSRFVPLSYEKPKGLLEVKGEILIERQITQLREAGICDIAVVVGYKADQFTYLKDRFGVNIVVNEDYSRYNNTSSVIRVVDRLEDTYICSSDNYFPRNVFLGKPELSYYSALYAEGKTEEYCLTTDEDDNIIDVRVGGTDSWYMVGHAFFNKEFSDKFRDFLIKDYVRIDTRLGYWEDVYRRYIKELPPMKMRRYQSHDIEEFDTLDELREYDGSYIDDTRSNVIKTICLDNGWNESSLSGFEKAAATDGQEAFYFRVGTSKFLYSSKKVIQII